MEKEGGEVIFLGWFGLGDRRWEMGDGEMKRSE